MTTHSRDISVKVRSQLQVKRKHGDFICPFAPYGYQKCEGNHNRIEPDPYAATVVQDIFNWKIQGMTNNGIAIRLAESGILRRWSISAKRRAVILQLQSEGTVRMDSAGSCPDTHQPDLYWNPPPRPSP